MIIDNCVFGSDILFHSNSNSHWIDSSVTADEILKILLVSCGKLSGTMASRICMISQQGLINGGTGSSTLVKTR